MSKYEPKTLVRQGEIVVNSAAEEAAARKLGYDVPYEKQHWPKAVHFKNGEKLARNEEEFNALIAKGGENRSTSLKKPKAKAE